MAHYYPIEIEEHDYEGISDGGASGSVSGSTRHRGVDGHRERVRRRVGGFNLLAFTLSPDALVLQQDAAKTLETKFTFDGTAPRSVDWWG